MPPFPDMFATADAQLRRWLDDSIKNAGDDYPEQEVIATTQRDFLPIYRKALEGMSREAVIDALASEGLTHTRRGYLKDHKTTGTQFVKQYLHGPIQMRINLDTGEPELDIPLALYKFQESNRVVPLHRLDLLAGLLDYETYKAEEEKEARRDHDIAEQALDLIRTRGFRGHLGSWAGTQLYLALHPGTTPN